MKDWQSALLSELREHLKRDRFWASRVSPPDGADSPRSIHLAVFIEPFLSFVLEGRKTVESRFSSRLRPPHKRVKKGDVIVLKESGGAVVGICEVSYVWFYELDPESLSLIQEKFADVLCADEPGFWDERKSKSYATLMKIHHVSQIGPVPCRKRDRRGWVVMQGSSAQEGLF